MADQGVRTDFWSGPGGDRALPLARIAPPDTGPKNSKKREPIPFRSPQHGKEEQKKCRGVKVDVRQPGGQGGLREIRITAVNQNESRILVARIPQDILQIHGVAFGKAVIVAAAYRAMDVNLKA